MRIEKDTPPRHDNTFIAALAVLYLALAFYWQDISLYDESFYLDSGTRFHLRSLLHSLSFAPLYAMWYRMLQIICPQPVWRYFLSWGILVTTLIALPACMKLRSAWLYAWLLVCVPFFGRSNFSIQPNITLFAAVPLLAGMCLVLRRRMDSSAAALAALVLTFIASFARPEFAYTTPLVAAIYLAISWRDRSQRQRTLWLPWTVTLCLLVITFRVIGHSDTSRSGIAFAQHYNLRAQLQHKLPPNADPWESDYALTVFHLEPGSTAANTSATLRQFAAADPRLFVQHITSNLLAPVTVLSGLAFVAALAWPWRREQAHAMRPASLYLLLVGVAPCISILLVYPEVHYFFLLCPLLLLYVLEISGLGEQPHTHYLPWLLALALPVVVWKTALRTALEHKTLRPMHPTVATIDCLRDLQRTVPGPNQLVYDALGVPAVFLPQDHLLVEEWDLTTWPVFSSWVVSAHPAWVEVTPGVAVLYHVPDAQVTDLLARNAYTPHACPATAPNAPLVVYVAPGSPR